MWRLSAVMLLAAFVGGCGEYGQSAPMGLAPGTAQWGGASPATGPERLSRSADALFVADAAHGSAAEIRLSRIALDRSDNAAIRDFAQQTIRQHERLNQELARVAADQGFGLPTRPPAATERLAQALARESGPRFDHDYMAQMVNDHIRALSLFDQASRTVRNPSIRALVERTVPDLQAHLQRAQELNQTVSAAVRQ